MVWTRIKAVILDDLKNKASHKALKVVESESYKTGKLMQSQSAKLLKWNRSILLLWYSTFRKLSWGAVTLVQHEIVAEERE